MFSPDRIYRYSLIRSVSMWGKGRCCFVMLNPSTADEVQNDPTVRRCINFAAGWGYASLWVVNIFALRATDPAELRKVTDPVGPENDAHLAAAFRQANIVIAAWGNQGQLGSRSSDVRALMARTGTPIRCLGMTAMGEPRHPLYVRQDTIPQGQQPQRALACPSRRSRPFAG